MSRSINARLGSVKGRWVYTIFLATAIILLVVIASLIYMICSRYYNFVELSLKSQVSQTVDNFFISCRADRRQELEQAATLYIGSFTARESMEVWVLDKNAVPIASSGGYDVSSYTDMPDYQNALASQDNVGVAKTKMLWGERVMALSYILRDADDAPYAAVRYITSLKNVDRQIIAVSALIVAAYFLMLLFIGATGLYFVDSLVKPVGQINLAAKKIASGDFNVRISGYEADDEIGRLCSAINEMAQRIGVADKMKNDFISTVSHEIRTPLTAIQGWGETLLGVECDDELSKKGLEVILKQTERLSGMVEELLDFSRIEDGRLSMKNGVVDVIAEVQQAYLVYQKRAENENKSLTLLFDGSETCFVAGDDDKICRVFVNILDNAVKYTESAGKIVISVEKEKNCVKIVFSDNGCGISAEDLKYVKEKFYKANNKVAGAGIGLAVADEIIKLHGGSLKIESSPGAGTTVTVSLPLIDAKEA